MQLTPASQSSADTPAEGPAAVTLPAPIEPQDPADPVDSGMEAGRAPSGERAGSGAGKQQKAERLEPVLRLSGTVSSPNCKREVTLQASAFNLELDVLKRKVDTYALAATFASLVQVFLVVFQMKQAATQAQMSRISIAAVFAQSLLDANPCMAHLLLCFAFPTLFFGSFIWIAVIKLLLFSVFQMRLIINIYQARYSQELSAEGWQGLRTRLLSLHARFYGAVLLILLVSITFYTRPVVAILALYSFWVPQILHSAYSGTKHSLHPAYLFGTSLARCFIPLYLLGCPNNFLTLLTIYINPQYLAVLSDAAVASASTGAADLQGLSLASASACWVLVLWQAAQLGMLLLQSSLGPRFFVPKQWLPQRYDYRRSIPASVRAALSNHSSDASAPTELSSSRDNGGDIAMTGIRSRGTSSTRINSGGYGGVAGGSSIGGGLHALLFGPRGGATGGGAGSGVRRSDSDDEEQDLETGSLLSSVPRRDRDREDAALSPARTGAVMPTDASAAGTGIGRHEAECVICYNPIRLSSGDYMITPCDHVFHEECLVRWTGVKLECPVCRAALPTMEEDQ